MIKWLVLSDFKSHKASDITFNPGLNIFLGEVGAGKTIINGRLRYGRINFGRTLNLDKPLIHNVVTNLKSAEIAIETVDTIEAQAVYLTDRGVSKDMSKRIAEWLEHSRDDLAPMQSRDLLRALRAVLRHGEAKVSFYQHE